MVKQTARKLAWVALTAAMLLWFPLRAEVVFSDDFEDMDLGDDWVMLHDDSVHLGFETRPEFVHSGKASFRITAPNPTGGTKVMHGYEYRESDSWILSLIHI